MSRTTSASASPQARLGGAPPEGAERGAGRGADRSALLSPEQQRRIQALIARPGATPVAKASPKAAKAARPEQPPRYWLPHSQETWSGRGRVPQSFLAWEGTVAHTEWKKHHPDERFPAFPG